MKKVIYLLAAWFLLEWVYSTKIKPFIISEFGPFGKKDSAVNGVLPVLQNSKGTYIYGIDIYHLDGKGYELEKLDKSKDSISFVICKATEGYTYIDPKFKGNWKILKNKGVIRGAYHLYNCDDTPLLQAENFLKQIDSITANDLPPVIDIEEPHVNTGCKNIQDGLIAFINIIQKKLGRRPMIYCNFHDAQTYLSDLRFQTYPLWIAEPDSKYPNLPFAWKKEGWTIWQRSTVYRLGNKNDFDIFNGSMDDMNNFIEKN